MKIYRNDIFYRPTFSIYLEEGDKFFCDTGFLWYELSPESYAKFLPSLPSLPPPAEGLRRTCVWVKFVSANTEEKGISLYFYCSDFYLYVYPSSPYAYRLGDYEVSLQEFESFVGA